MSFSSEFEVEVVKGLLEVVVVEAVEAKVVPVVVLPAEEKGFWQTSLSAQDRKSLLKVT